MSRDVEQFAAEAEQFISELAEQARDAIRQTEQQAAEAISRFHELRREQEQAEDREAELKTLLERLPTEHSKAVLDGDEDRQNTIASQYREAKAELHQLQARAPEVERELTQLAPRRVSTGEWHRHDITLNSWSKVGRVFEESTRPLYRLQGRLESAIRQAVAPLEHAQQRRAGAMESMHSEIRWERNQRQEHQEAG